jgi:hypothetical protein
MRVIATAVAARCELTLDLRHRELVSLEALHERARLGGISHARAEDTAEDDLAAGIESLHKLVSTLTNTR